MSSFFTSTLGLFRLIALLEGVSYLVLLGIAMPLKYMADYKSAVLYTGWVHGALFVAFMILLSVVWIKYEWSFKKVLFAFIASLLPFGTFVLDSKIR
jgi:integral membrane protein